jgi:hypothetical protein
MRGAPIQPVMPKTGSASRTMSAVRLTALAMNGGSSISSTWHSAMPSRSFFASAYSGEVQKRLAASLSGHSEMTIEAPAPKLPCP